MQRGTSKSHEFVFRNTGKSPLTVRVGATSCKCTVGKVSKNRFAPGESVPVKLEWSALVNPGAIPSDGHDHDQRSRGVARRAVGRR